MRGAVTLAEFRQLRSGRGRVFETRRIRRGHVSPDVAVALFAGETAGVNAVDAELGVRSDRWNLAALAGARVEAPAVIAAFDRFAVGLAAGKRHAAMRTNVVQSKGFTAGVAANHQRHIEEHRAPEIASANLMRTQRRIPKIPQHSAVGVRRRGASNFGQWQKTS